MIDNHNLVSIILDKLYQIKFWLKISLDLIRFLYFIQISCQATNQIKCKSNLISTDTKTIGKTITIGKLCGNWCHQTQWPISWQHLWSYWPIRRLDSDQLLTMSPQALLTFMIDAHFFVMLFTKIFLSMFTYLWTSFDKCWQSWVILYVACFCH